MMKLAAFDLDGTLADTLADLAAAVNFALEKRGLSPYPTEDYRQFVGNGVDNLMKTVLREHYTPQRAEEMKADFFAYYAGHCLDMTVPYPGIAELLDFLEEQRVMTAVISNKPNDFVQDILLQLYPGHLFSVAWGQHPEIPRKPAPDGLNKAMELLGVSPQDTLYIGDSNVDVVFAHNAGVKVCGVSWGFRGARELEEAGADIIVDTAQELKEVILKALHE